MPNKYKKIMMARACASVCQGCARTMAHECLRVFTWQDAWTRCSKRRIHALLEAIEDEDKRIGHRWLDRGDWCRQSPMKRVPH